MSEYDMIDSRTKASWEAAKIAYPYTSPESNSEVLHRRGKVMAYGELALKAAEEIVSNHLRELPEQEQQRWLHLVERSNNE